VCLTIRVTDQAAGDASMTNEVTRHWTVSTLVVLTWIVLAFPLFLLGIWLFGAVYLLTHGVREFSVELGIVELLLLLVISSGLLVLHELVHGLAMLRMGAAPSFGADILLKMAPVLYTTAPGHRFSRREYLVVALAPMVVISGLGAAWVAIGPFGKELVSALALHLTGCIGDLWIAGLILRQPSETTFEDRRDGFTLRRWSSPMPHGPP
jgi:hypothetical protein